MEVMHWYVICSSYHGISLKFFQSVDLSKLQDIEIKWKGKVYQDIIPDEICQDVLYDIFFISFVTEFLLADRYLYVLKRKPVEDGDTEEGEVIDELDATTREERNIKVMNALPGLNDEVLGFGSSNLMLRQQTLYGFYRVMLGWSRMPTPHEDVCYAAEDVVAPDILDYAEYVLAYHYIATFADFFKRAPVCPHLAPK